MTPHNKASNRQQNAQRGVTLVELMISLLIGSILLLGVVSLFIASSQTQRVQQHLNYVSEDMRFLSEFLSYDVRMAGYVGDCDEDDLGDPITWNSDLLTLRYCDDDDSDPDFVEIEYEFDSADARVSYDDDPLVEGVRLADTFPRFGNENTTDRLVSYEDEPGGDRVRTVEFAFEFTGPEDDPPADFDDPPEVRFVVAVRNATLNRLDPDAGNGDED